MSKSLHLNQIDYQWFTIIHNRTVIKCLQLTVRLPSLLSVGRWVTPVVSVPSKGFALNVCLTKANIALLKQFFHT